MRFNITDYDKVFPRVEKPKPKKEDESMLSEIEKPSDGHVATEKEKEEFEDGMGTDGESNSE